MMKPVAVEATELAVEARPVNPLRNPSYPPRVHVYERAHWLEVLRSCEDRIARARQKLDVLGAGPQRPGFERLYAQMLGARDQVAAAVRRLPTEVGELYAEDHHRLEAAVAALDRVLKRWDSQ